MLHTEFGKQVWDHALGGPSSAIMDAPDVWLDFDRFAHPNGLRGTYLDLGDRFWAAMNAGRRAGLRMTDRD